MSESSSAKTTLLRFPASNSFPVEAVRKDFPALHQKIHDKSLVYLDNSATTQKPHDVINAITRFYTEDCANVHRGVHELSQRATNAYEGAREVIKSFLNAKSSKEIVYVRGTTEAINLVAQSFGHDFGRGDEIVVSTMEHHSNIVPWQMLAERTGAVLRVAPITDAGELDLAAFETMLSTKTRLVAMVHVSNALGTITPVKRIVELAHAVGAKVLIDGAQAVAHTAVDVRALDVDFYAFSGHKLFGPTGIGVLYGKEGILEAMPPWQGGGDMIASVSFERTTYNSLPHKFEAGTPHIDGPIGLAAAIRYVQRIGLSNIAAYEHELVVDAGERLAAIPGVRMIGTAREKASVVSFTLKGVHPHDIGTILDREGIAVRAGHHCAEPVMRRFGVPATARASFAFYNTHEEIDRLVAAVLKTKEIFGV